MLLSAMLLLFASQAMQAQAGGPAPPSPHADPLNYDPVVRDGFLHFYNLDYEGALARFEQVEAAHQDYALAHALVLMVVIFRELYHQDLLDTTYYAHDSFLTTKRRVDVAEAVRQRIEDLTNRVSTLADERMKQPPNAGPERQQDALFARGFARGLHASFITLADHSYFAAARQGLAARNDSEAVLKIDPGLCGCGYGDRDPAVCGGEPAARGAHDGGDRGRGGQQGTRAGAGAGFGDEGGDHTGGRAHDAVAVSAPRRTLWRVA